MDSPMDCKPQRTLGACEEDGMEEVLMEYRWRMRDDIDGLEAVTVSCWM
jgi:hypothetical protein